MFSTTSENYWMFMNIIQHTNWTTPSNPVFCRGYVNQYFDNKEEDVHKDTFRQIAIDVPRMSPLVGLFQQRLVQEMVERILYIWAIRSPHIILYDHWSIIHYNTSATSIGRRLWTCSCFNPMMCILVYFYNLQSLYMDRDVQASCLWLCPGY